MNPIGVWVLISWLLKKMFDHKDRYLSEEEYNRIAEQHRVKEEADASLTKLLHERKLLSSSKKVR